MTAGAARKVPPAGSPGRGARLPLAGLRLVQLHLASRRVPVAVAAVAACAAGLRIALHWPWDTYGAVQLPLVFEAASAAVIAVTTASPFGEPERVTGRWLPFLRLATALALTAVAAGALLAAATGAHLTGGALDVLRNVAGLTGIGLLCAAVIGGGLAWAGPLAYMVVAAYELYAAWHGGALTTPWIWPARPPHDAGAAICAGLVFAAGILVITVRGARDSTSVLSGRDE
jgi:hypothetical protein